MNDLINEGIKVDLILTDLPFGVTNCKWDKVIPFEPMWDCINDLSTDITTCLFFGVEPFSTLLRNSNLVDYKYDLYWVKNKSSGFLHSKNKPLNSIECISVFSKGDVNHSRFTNHRMVYNPQGLVKCNKKVLNNKKYSNTGATVYEESSFENNDYVQEYTNYPKNLLYFDVVSKNKTHPTEKPIDLLEYLIKTYSNPNDIILDFTMGTGSCGVACQYSDRDFIGVELDKEYYNIAVERMKIFQSRLI